MDHFIYVVEEKIHVVNEAEEDGCKFGVDPIALDGDNTGPFQRSDDFQKRLLYLCSVSVIAQRFDGMPFIRTQGGNTVWRVRAGREASCIRTCSSRGVSRTGDHNKDYGKQGNMFHGKTLHVLCRTICTSPSSPEAKPPSQQAR